MSLNGKHAGRLKGGVSSRKGWCEPSINLRHRRGQEELRDKLMEYTFNIADLPRWVISKFYMHLWTGLNANAYHMSNELSRK